MSHSLLNVILPDSLLSKDMQEPRAESAPRRQSCIIVGRHPGTPSEVPVVCRQLTGTMLLSDCCQQLRIRYNGSELAPPDFEAAAGCSKGKNWKVPNPEPQTWSGSVNARECCSNLMHCWTQKGAIQALRAVCKHAPVVWHMSNRS